MTAAIEIADTKGLEAVSSRAIASRLGVGPTSMYWHVPNQADLYELMYDAALGELALPTSLSRNWLRDMADLAHQMHAVFGRHPWLVLLGIQPGIGPNSRRYGEFAINVLTHAGLHVDIAIQVVALVNNYVLGFAHRRTAWDALRRRAGLEDQWQERLDSYLADVEATDATLAEHIKTRARLTSEGNFELGLRCVLDGIRVHFDLPAQAQAPTAKRSARRRRTP